MSLSRSPADQETARAFASSWNTVGEGSVYTKEQFLDWIAPVDPRELEGLQVLELGFGNGSLMFHMAGCGPSRLCGIELGDTLEQTRRNLSHVRPGVVDLHQGDLTTEDLGRFDFVYCIGVLHHLADPGLGFESVLRHTRPGGRFHCWVYAHEGNGLVRALVEPLRRAACRLPWWLTKYGLALPLVLPYFLYAKASRACRGWGLLPAALLDRLPLSGYTRWIQDRPFRFFHHVAFDQLVTPRTVYIRRGTVEGWLASSRIEPSSTYIIHRNGNSWKFGGRKASGEEPAAG